MGPARDRLSHPLGRSNPAVMRRHMARRDHIREKAEILRKRRVGRRIVWVLVAWLVFRAFWVLAFRFQFRPIIDEVRAFNKRILNPAMMKLAGRRHWYAAVIRHKGRRSRKDYATPIWAEPTEDGFVIPLPYGEEVDWLRNVLKAGWCTIEAKGIAYDVAEPEVVEAAVVEPVLPSWPRFVFRLYGVRSYLKVKILVAPAQTKTHNSARGYPTAMEGRA